MRLYALTSTLLFLLLPATGTHADSGTGLYPPGLQPLIARANVLLSTGQFNDAAKAYSEAIGGFAVLFCGWGLFGVFWGSAGKWGRLRNGALGHDAWRLLGLRHWNFAARYGGWVIAMSPLSLAARAFLGTSLFDRCISRPDVIRICGGALGGIRCHGCVHGDGTAQWSTRGCRLGLQSWSPVQVDRFTNGCPGRLRVSCSTSSQPPPSALPLGYLSQCILCLS
ncbi:hypothetical protein DFH06DRAFT_1129493 [Mycena polygramma]|nr:hypothetical protein DFH06DRAFT_1129493 [Mycena polygramma]